MQEEPQPEDAPAGSEASQPTRGIVGMAVLGLAMALAIAAGAYLLVSGGDSGETEVTVPAGLANPYPNTGPIDPNRPKEGEPAPDFALVDARDQSKVIRLSDYRGKVVILNWFASWCDPCKDEIPAFQKAEAKFGGDLVVLGVDYLERPSDALSILDELGATYPAVLDAAGTVAQHYRVTYMPTTFFIDKEGILRATRTGEVYEDALIGFLEKTGLTYAP